MKSNQMSRRTTPAARTSRRRVRSASKRLLRRWQARLVHRKYLELFEPSAAGQYSVRIAQRGTGSYFPLGTSDEALAAAQALEIHRVIQRKGRPFAQQHHSREFTLAIFWSDNPLLCTYTTLLTLCGATPLPAATQTETPTATRTGIRVAVVEADTQVRRALAVWVNAVPGCQSAGSFADCNAGTLKLIPREADLVLFNRSQADKPRLPGAVGDAKEGAPPEMPFIPFGIYETSDDIFISHTGVSRGYFLRRTHPQATLDPIRTVWAEGATGSSGARLHLQRYFQALIEDVRQPEDASKQSALTPREEEILLRLSKGYPDKQIAGALNISSWTVHNHMKNIFRKLGVHTRTQAVLKYLQR